MELILEYRTIVGFLLIFAMCLSHAFLSIEHHRKTKDYTDHFYNIAIWPILKNHKGIPPEILAAHKRLSIIWRATLFSLLGLFFAFGLLVMEISS
jgi:hypothetical protein